MSEVTIDVMIDGPSLPPASGSKPRQIVVLLHGYGSNGADMIQLAPLWRAALPDALFLAPNGPERSAYGGYQWWALNDFSRRGLAAGVGRAAPRLEAYLDAQLAEHGLSDAQLLLAGFSQGTMMALHVGPCRQEKLAGIIGYSGMIADAAGLPAKIRSKPPILLVHGTADKVVPFGALKEAETELHRLGFEVETHAARGLGHGVDPAGLELGRNFARKVLLGA
jgi:phospholipase/carboxylesterase